ncbi:Ig-like domain-containing protein [Aeromicrobium sp. UC242_57]|uniref:Ig-like domain-containing protein n=1 Tax=Aeromicrobium sp. UC242_57 TaxID=3374624 RepID=UPI0037B5EDC7
MQVDAGGTVAITSPISGAGGLTKTSPGNLRLTHASSSYTGATTVSAGQLTVDGLIASSSSVQVASGATLAGSGVVPAVSVAGNLTPRGLATGNLSLTSTSAMSVDLAADTNDRVDVAGTVQLSGPVLEPSLAHVPSVGDSFTIVDNDGSDAVSGTFADLPEGAYLIVDGARLQISYVGGSGNDIVLTAALAPTTTTVSSSVPSAVTGEPITFTATTTSEGTAVPGGTTRFLVDGDQAQAPTSVDAAGKATFTTDSLPIGETTVTAEYVGPTGFADSDESRIQSVGAAGTTTTLTVPAGPLVTGQPVSLSATVSPTSPGGGSPAGDVTFYDGDAQLGTGSVNSSGLATYVADSLSVGPQLHRQ